MRFTITSLQTKPGISGILHEDHAWFASCATERRTWSGGALPVISVYTHPSGSAWDFEPSQRLDRCHRVALLAGSPSPGEPMQGASRKQLWIGGGLGSIRGIDLWLWRLGSNQRMRESKSLAFPLGYTTSKPGFTRLYSPVEESPHGNTRPDRHGSTLPTGHRNLLHRRAA